MRSSWPRPSPPAFSPRRAASNICASAPDVPHYWEDISSPFPDLGDNFPLLHLVCTLLLCGGLYGELYGGPYNKVLSSGDNALTRLTFAKKMVFADQATEDHYYSEKDAKLAQKLGQLQPLMAVFLLECMGQLASFGLT